MPSLSEHSLHLSRAFTRCKPRVELVNRQLGGVERPFTTLSSIFDNSNAFLEHSSPIREHFGLWDARVVATICVGMRAILMHLFHSETEDTIQYLHVQFEVDDPSGSTRLYTRASPAYSMLSSSRFPSYLRTPAYISRTWYDSNKFSTQVHLYCLYCLYCVLYFFTSWKGLTSTFSSWTYLHISLHQYNTKCPNFWLWGT